MAKKKTNNRLAYGLCKKYGIKLPKDAPPRVAWEMLEKKTGITMLDAYTNLEHLSVMEKSTNLYDCKNSEHEGTKELESIVFDKISIYRRQLLKNDFVVFSANSYDKKYFIKLYGVEYDYKYEILWEEDI